MASGSMSVSSVQISAAGAREVLTSPGVAAKLLAMGNAAAAAARASNPSGSYMVTGQPGRTRFRVSVITANYSARKSEAENRNLTAAINAARGL